MRDEIVSTGLPDLDVLLGGGVPRHHTIVVTGHPGAGKTLLCSQIAFAQARRGAPVVIATVTSEPHDKLVEELRHFEFCDESRIGEEIFFLSAVSWLKRGAREARELILRTVAERRARFLFIDGLRSLRDLWQDESKLREFLYDIGVGLTTADCIGLFSTEYDAETLKTLPEATTVDGIVALSLDRVGARRMRRIEVTKLRGQRHLLGTHAFTITRAGIVITPRIETTTSSDATVEFDPGRAAFGRPELDALLRGGLPRQSSTLIAGSTGIGKTLLALHFAAEGARAGEQALFVSYYEPPDLLASRARNVGLDVRPLLASGDLEILYRPPLDLDPDVLAQEVLRRTAEKGTRRVVFDGVAELERAVLDPSRSREYFVALLMRLRVARVTTTFTKEVGKLAGSDIDFSDTPTSLIAENLLFLRHVELRSRIHRVLSILKMRASAYDPDLREFQITSSGLNVLEPFRSASGLLTGVARIEASP